MKRRCLTGPIDWASLALLNGRAAPWARARAAVAASLIGLWALGCSGGGPQPFDVPDLITIRLTSPAFEDGAAIPKAHSCDGADRSPPLKWSGVPKNTRSFALFCDDPDAPLGTWSHWVVVNLPASAVGLAEGIPAARELPAASIAMDGPSGTDNRAAASDGAAVAAVQGTNDFGKPGYGGPCPPSGSHRYIFRLFALDRRLDVDAKAKLQRAEVLKAVRGHVLAEGRLNGRYARAR